MSNEINKRKETDKFVKFTCNCGCGCTWHTWEQDKEVHTCPGCGKEQEIYKVKDWDEFVKGSKIC